MFLTCTSLLLDPEGFAHSSMYSHIIEFFLFFLFCFFDWGAMDDKTPPLPVAHLHENDKVTQVPLATCGCCPIDHHALAHDMVIRVNV